MQASGSMPLRQAPNPTPPFRRVHFSNTVDVGDAGGPSPTRPSHENTAVSGTAMASTPLTQVRRPLASVEETGKGEKIVAKAEEAVASASGNPLSVEEMLYRGPLSTLRSGGRAPTASVSPAALAGEVSNPSLEGDVPTRSDVAVEAFCIAPFAGVQRPVPEPQLQWLQQSKDITQQWRKQCDMLQTQVEALQSEVSKSHSVHHHEQLKLQSSILRLSHQLAEADQARHNLCDEKALLAVELCRAREELEKCRTQPLEQFEMQKRGELEFQERCARLSEEHAKELDNQRRESDHWKHACDETARDKARLETTILQLELQLLEAQRHSNILKVSNSPLTCAYVSPDTVRRGGNGAVAEAQPNLHGLLFDEGQNAKIENQDRIWGEKGLEVQDATPASCLYSLTENETIQRRHILLLRKELAEAERTVQSLRAQEVQSAAEAMAALDAERTQHEVTCRALEQDREALMNESSQLRLQLHSLRSELVKHSEKSALHRKAQDREAFESGRLHEHCEWVQFLSRIKDSLMEWMVQEELNSPPPLAVEEQLSPSQLPSYDSVAVFESIKHIEIDSTLDSLDANSSKNAKNAYEALIELLKQRLLLWREAARQTCTSLTKGPFRNPLEETCMEKSTSVNFILEIDAATPIVSCAGEKEATLLAEIKSLKNDVCRLQEELSTTYKKHSKRAREWDSLRPSMEKLLNHIQNARRECSRTASSTLPVQATTMKKRSSSMAALAVNLSSQREEDGEGKDAIATPMHTSDSFSGEAKSGVSDTKNDSPDESKEVTKMMEEESTALALSSFVPVTSLSSLLEVSYKSLLELLNAFREQRNRLQRGRSKQASAITALEAELVEERRKNSEMQARIAQSPITTRTQEQKLKERVERYEKESKRLREEAAELTKRSEEFASQKVTECEALRVRLRAAEGCAERLAEEQAKLATLTQEHTICLETLREAMQDRERLLSRRNCQEESVILLENELRAERENVALLHTTLEHWTAYTVRILLTNIGLINQTRWRKLLSKADRVEQCQIRQWLEQRAKSADVRDFPLRGVRRVGSWFAYFKTVGLVVLALVYLKNLVRSSYSRKESPGSDGEEEATWGDSFPHGGSSAVNSLWKKSSKCLYEGIEEAVAAGASQLCRRRWVSFAGESKPPSGDATRLSQALSPSGLEGQTGGKARGEVELVPFYPLISLLVESATPSRGHQLHLGFIRCSASLPVKLPPPAELVAGLRRLFQLTSSNRADFTEVHNIGHVPVEFPLPLNAFSRDMVSASEEQKILGKPSDIGPTSLDAKPFRIPPGVAINYLLQSLSVERRQTRFTRKTSRKSRNGQKFGDHLLALFAELDLLPSAPPHAAHILAYNGFVQNRTGGGTPTLIILEEAWGRLHDENAALVAQLQGRANDAEATDTQRKRLEEMLTAQKIAFEAEKREETKRRLEASEKAASLLHAAEAKYEHVRERLKEAQHCWQKEVEVRRCVEEKVSRYQQEQFAYMAKIHALRNEIRSLNMELSFFTGHGRREQSFSDPNRQLLVLNSNKVNSSYETSATLATVIAAGGVDSKENENHTKSNAQSSTKASPFMSLEKEAPRNERYCGSPVDPRQTSPGQQYSTPDKRDPAGQGVRIGGTSSRFQSVDFSAECPLSAIPFRSSLNSSSSEFLSTSPTLKQWQSPHRGPPLPDPQYNSILGNALDTSDNLPANNSPVVSPLDRSTTLTPSHPTRAATYMHQLLRGPKTNTEALHPPPLPSSVNNSTQGMEHLRGNNSNPIGTGSSAMYPPFSLELYVPQVIRQHQVAVETPVDSKKKIRRISFE